MKATEAWFDEIVDATRNGLSRYLRSLVHDPDDLQDVLQDAYLRVFCLLKKDGLSGHNPAALLYTTARNLAISRIRHQQVIDRSKATVMISEELRCQRPNTEEQASQRMRKQTLLLALNRLPPKCRAVLVRRMLHGMSHRDIAEELGISVSTVEKHLAKGLRLCKAQVAKSVGSDSAASTAGGQDMPMTGTGDS